jgi:death on curing protein
MIVWIEKRLLLLLHDRQIAEHGGLQGVRDESLLESALARPHQRFAYADPPPDLADLAASLAHGIARNHAFVDGSKRSALVACETFIELNGAELTATDVEIYPVILALATGQLTEAEFSTWLRARLRLRPGLSGVQEPPARYGRASRPAGKRAARVPSASGKPRRPGA